VNHVHACAWCFLTAILSLKTGYRQILECLSIVATYDDTSLVVKENLFSGYFCKTDIFQLSLSCFQRE